MGLHFWKANSESDIQLHKMSGKLFVLNIIQLNPTCEDVDL